MRLKEWIFMAIISAFSPFMLIASIQSLKRISVCDVLVNPTKFNSQVIAVRGILTGTDEGIWLHGNCKSHLITKGLSWPSDLWVETDPMDLNAMASWTRLDTQLKRMHADIARDKVWVTIVGQLETRKSMNDEVALGPDGHLVHAGFGHMGAAAAAINVRMIEKVVVEDVTGLKRKSLSSPPKSASESK